MGVVELVWWAGTDEFLADLDGLFKPTIDHVSSAEGCLRIFTGREVQPNAENFWMIVDWENQELHQAMMAREDYPAMVGRLKPFFRDGQLKMKHVKFNRDTDAAFSAPVTTLAFLKMKEKTTMEDVDRVADVTQHLCKPDEDGRPRTAWGHTEEDERLALISSGWDSLEARDTVMHEARNKAENSDTLAEIYKKVEPEARYLSLKGNFSRK